ncbi:TPA: hypothetical protein N0F65_011714 [Lagenidium giganteum]|uniref:Transposase n=1 Tax=Lagenidium giganteum TaxID=4803 RepID=A0AAV2YXA4_9STRA|nr:TPA: hypothetical protein N0F65_011714 [Lagenidium giganteum]
MHYTEADWKNVVFIDECNVERFRKCGREWRGQLFTEQILKATFKSQCLSGMVWGYITWEGDGALHI